MASARRTLIMRLGRASRSCAFCVDRASESTSTRSPPTASVRALRSVMLVTTRSLSAAKVGEGLHIRVDIEALAIAMSRLVDPVRVRHENIAEGDEVLSVGREERALPSRGRVLVLHVKADDGARFLLRRVTVGDGRAELDGAEVPQVEEGADATGCEGVPERLPAERDVVLAIEDAAKELQVEG